MEMTLELAARWSKRLHKSLTKIEAGPLTTSLAATRELFASAAGCASWHEFETHLSGSSARSSGNPSAESVLTQWSKSTVDAAIVTSFENLFNADDNSLWPQRTIQLLKLVLGFLPEGVTIAEIRAALDLDALVLNSGLPEIRRYVSALPGFAWQDPEPIKMGEVTLSDLTREQHAYVSNPIYPLLDRWELLCNGSASAYGAPFSLQILMLCVENGIEWPDGWHQWFHGSGKEDRLAQKLMDVARASGRSDEFVQIKYPN